MKSTRKSQDLINLNEIKNPHPNIVKAYKDSGAQEQFYPYDETSEYINEKRIFLIAQAKNPPTTIRHKIISIYRKKVGNNKEYCFFYEHLMTRDYFNNFVDHTRTVGKYEFPIIVTHYGVDPSTIGTGVGKPIGPGPLGTEFEGVETRYNWEWERIRPQLIKWYDEGIIDEKTTFTAQKDSRKYTVETWDQFINLKFEELILLNRVGDKVTGLFDPTQNITDKILAMAKDAAKEEVQKTLKETSHARGRVLDKIT